LVGTDAQPAVRRPLRLGSGQGGPALAAVEHHKVVSQAVHFQKGFAAHLNSVRTGPVARDGAPGPFRMGLIWSGAPDSPQLSGKTVRHARLAGGPHWTAYSPSASISGASRPRSARCCSHSVSPQVYSITLTSGR